MMWHGERLPHRTTGQSDEGPSALLILSKKVIALEDEVKRLRKREATFDAFIDSLDCHNEHEWMLIERIDEIDEKLHGGEGE